MECVTIWCWLVVFSNPIVRDDARVEIAHDGLSKIIHAVLVMALVHFRNALLIFLCIREIVHVVILPDKVQAMEVMSPHGNRNVSAAHLRWKLYSCEIMPDAFNVVRSNANSTVCIKIVSFVVLYMSYRLGTPTFQQICPSLVHLWRWWALVGRLVPQRALEPVIHVFLLDAFIYWSLNTVSVLPF